MGSGLKPKSDGEIRGQDVKWKPNDVDKAWSCWFGL